MANYCNNSLSFSGNPDNIQAFWNLFKELDEKSQADNNRGQLPDFISETEHPSWFFYIQLHQEDLKPGDTECSLSFETKWGPDVPLMVKIAEKMGVEFEMYYDESSNGVHGEAIYKDGKLLHIDLDHEDTDQYALDDETDEYIFRGERYDSDMEIIEILLEEKKQKLQNQ